MTRVRSISPQLLVTDLDRAIGFWTNVLGFQVEFRYEDFYAGIARDGHILHLKLGAPRRRWEHEDLEVVITVTDIDAYYEQVGAAGANVLQTIRDMPYGREFYVADPDGNALGFASAPQ